jgi:hypothetical protein
MSFRNVIVNLVEERGSVNMARGRFNARIVKETRFVSITV